MIDWLVTAIEWSLVFCCGLLVGCFWGARARDEYDEAQASAIAKPGYGLDAPLPPRRGC